MARIRFISLTLLFSMFVGLASAELINTGTYSFSTEASKLTYWGGDVATTDPIAFTVDPVGSPGDLHSVLGLDDGKIASWNNGSNQIGTGGVEITFDLGEAYKIGSVTTTHSVANYWGVGSVDFYYSVNGQDFSFLGSNGGSDTVIGEYSRTYDYNEVEARYLKVHVHSISWRNLEVDSVMIDAAALPEPATVMLLAGGSLLALRRKRK